MYERPCIVDDSKNSLKISIFPFVARRQCKLNHTKKSHLSLLLCVFPIFRHRYVSLRLLDDCPLGTGVRKPSNEVHKGIDVGEFYIINHKGHSKGSDNQLNQQTVFIVASHGGCWCNKFFDCFILQHKTSTSLCWFKWRQGPPTDNTNFQLQLLKVISPQVIQTNDIFIQSQC